MPQHFCHWVVKDLLGLEACFEYIPGAATLNQSVFVFRSAIRLLSACADVVAKLQPTTLHTFKRCYYFAAAVSATTCRSRQNNIVGKNTFAYVNSFEYAPHAQAPFVGATPGGLLLPVRA